MTIHPDQSTASRLLRAVIAKSFVEFLFVCVIATVAAFLHFSPLLRGSIDMANQTKISGWVHDPLSLDEAIEVQLFIDGRFVAAKSADERRDDLVRAGATTRPNHGFTFRLESFYLANGSHTAQVYAVRETSSPTKSLIPISKTSRMFQVNR